MMTWRRLLIGLCFLILGVPALGHSEASPAPPAQTVLGPGIYAFQTRTRSATCGDAEKDGYVLSYLAALDGVPGSATMTMQLVNTAHFKDWKLTVSGSAIVGESTMGTGAEAPESHFEVTFEKDRFKGTGSRSYFSTINGQRQRCRVQYDALLRRLDG